MDRVDELVREHLEPEVAERLAGAIRQAKTRPVLLLTDANHDGTFGLLLLTADGIEFLAPDGRVVLEVRDDIVLADPRHRGSLAVIFSDGEELTFNGIGDGAWTRQLAQAINDHANEGATVPVPPAERRAVLTTPLKGPQETRYQGALYVALALKLCAVLVVIGGVVVAIGGADEVSDSGGSTSAFAAYSIAAATLSALVLAFFGYTLEVLIDIWENTWVTRTIAEED